MDEEIQNDEVIAGFLEQTKVATPAPTTRAQCLWFTAHYQPHLNRHILGPQAHLLHFPMLMMSYCR